MSVVFSYAKRVFGFLPRLFEVGFYVSMGPIAGPIAAVAVRYLRKGEVVLAGLWAVTIPLIWLDIASLTAWLAHRLHVHWPT
ncbi:MAG TPA: hypothetical protein VG269_01990 [Tepidisphaeraceae bacterium]|jgi:hypothetical protein|nr:hypothetical protein [Tepidisphaeraceae bacterium]